MKKALIIVGGLVILGVTFSVLQKKWYKKQDDKFDADCVARGYRVTKRGSVCEK